MVVIFSAMKLLILVLLLAAGFMSVCVGIHFGILHYVKVRKSYFKGRSKVDAYNKARPLVFCEVIMISLIPAVLYSFAIWFGNGLHDDVVGYTLPMVVVITIVYDIYLSQVFFVKEEYMRRRYKE